MTGNGCGLCLNHKRVKVPPGPIHTYPIKTCQIYLNPGGRAFRSVPPMVVSYYMSRSGGSHLHGLIIRWPKSRTTPLGQETGSELLGSQQRPILVTVAFPPLLLFPFSLLIFRYLICFCPELVLICSSTARLCRSGGSLIEAASRRRRRASPHQGKMATVASCSGRAAETVAYNGALTRPTISRATDWANWKRRELKARPAPGRIHRLGRCFGRFTRHS